MNDKIRRTPTTPILRSRLVQRLTPNLGRPNPFSFGGGLRNGGLQDEAVKMLPFGFDYMGVAEFEWGIVPSALGYIHENSADYIAGVIDVNGAAVYFICFAADLDEVVERIKGWAADEYNHELKESTYLARAIRNDPHCRAVGWLELNNGFFFFTDEQMWKDTVALFGVAVPFALTNLGPA